MDKHQLPPRRFDLRESVQVDWCDGVYIGVIEAVEPGSNLCPPLPGWVYHVRLAGNDTMVASRVIVGEEKLRKLTED